MSEDNGDELSLLHGGGVCLRWYLFASFDGPEAKVLNQDFCPGILDLWSYLNLLKRSTMVVEVKYRLAAYYLLHFISFPEMPLVPRGRFQIPRPVSSSQRRSQTLHIMWPLSRWYMRRPMGGHLWAATHDRWGLACLLALHDSCSS